jgi:hypothetical protein
MLSGTARVLYAFGVPGGRDRTEGLADTALPSL